LPYGLGGHGLAGGHGLCGLHGTGWHIGLHWDGWHGVGLAECALDAINVITTGATYAIFFIFFKNLRLEIESSSGISFCSFFLFSSSI